MTLDEVKSTIPIQPELDRKNTSNNLRFWQYCLYHTAKRMFHHNTCLRMNVSSACKGRHVLPSTNGEMCVLHVFQRLRSHFESTISNKSWHPKACKVHPLLVLYMQTWAVFNWKMNTLTYKSTIFSIHRVIPQCQHTYRTP